MNTQILHAVLYVVGSVAGPVHPQAWRTAHDAGFLAGGSLSYRLKAGIVNLKNEAYEAGEEIETPEAAARMVVGTLDWRRADSGEVSAEICAALARV